MSPDTFTEAQYIADPKSIVAHAMRWGRATVVRPDGSIRVVISVPRAEVTA